jgi:hypothetical protein
MTKKITPKKTSKAKTFIIKYDAINSNWLPDDDEIFMVFPELQRTQYTYIDIESLVRLLTKYQYNCFTNDPDNYNRIFKMLTHDKPYLIGLVDLKHTVASGFIYAYEIEPDHEFDGEGKKEYYITDLCRYNKSSVRQRESPIKTLMDTFKKLILKIPHNKTLNLKVDVRKSFSALVLNNLYITKYKFKLGTYDTYSNMVFKKSSSCKIRKREQSIINLYEDFKKHIIKIEKIHGKLTIPDKRGFFDNTYKPIYMKILQDPKFVYH